MLIFLCHLLHLWTAAVGAAAHHVYVAGATRSNARFLTAINVVNVYKEEGTRLSLLLLFYSPFGVVVDVVEEYSFVREPRR